MNTTALFVIGNWGAQNSAFTTWQIQNNTKCQTYLEIRIMHILIKICLQQHKVTCLYQCRHTHRICNYTPC